MPEHAAECSSALRSLTCDGSGCSCWCHPPDVQPADKVATFDELAEAQQRVAQLPEHPLERARSHLLGAEILLASGEAYNAAVQARIAAGWIALAAAEEP